MTPLRLAGFAALAACAAARAQDAPVELDTMQVTAARHSESVAAIPQAVSVVGAEEIARSTPRVVTDLLRGETGVYLQSSGPGQGVVIVRGLKGSEVLHLVDGMRLNNTFFRNSPSQYIALVDAYNVDRVEVLRGPASTIYGSDAMGGVVQFLTPEHRFGGDGWTGAGGALAQYGSADLSKTGRGWAAVGTNGFSLAGGVTYVDAGGVKTGGADRIDDALTGYFARGYDGKALFAPVAGHELMLAHQFYEYPELPRYFEISVQPNNVPAGVPQRTEAQFEPNDRTFTHARYRSTLPVAFLDSFEAHVARQVVNDDRSVVPQPPTVPPARREREANRSTLDGVTLQAHSQVEGTQLTYGAEYYRDAIDSTKRCEPLAGGCPATASVPVFPDGAEQRSSGAYLSTEMRLFDRWLLDAGIRYSHVRTDLTATALSAAASVEDDALTGNIGSALTLAPGLNWTFNVGRGFRAPNIFDLGTLGPRGGSTQINVPNPNLRPETLDSIDTGFKWRGGGLRGELVAFYTRYENRIEAREPTGNTIPDGLFGCTTAAGCPEVHSVNISEARYWGWEAGAGYAPGRELDLYANVNWTRGAEQRPGAASTPANRVPPLNARFGAVWDPATYLVELFVLCSDAQRRLDADDRDDVRIAPGGTPGWATLNARLGWEPVTTLRLQVEGVNLLDQRYREHGSGIEGFGRSVTATAELRF